MVWGGVQGVIRNFLLKVLPDDVSEGEIFKMARALSRDIYKEQDRLALRDVRRRNEFREHG